MATKTKRFTDATIDAIADFKDDSDNPIRGRFWDAEVKGLQLRIGERRMSWFFFQQHRTHGTRRTICRRLGHWPAMKVADARAAATVIAADKIKGTVAPGKRESIKFGEAFEKYLDHLGEKAEKAGKPPRWQRNVRQLGKQLILPKWEKWPLADMSANPGAVESWHRDVTRSAGPVSANHAARVVRAVYKRAARHDRYLPPGLPTSAVEFNSEKPSQKGLALADFPKWRKAWDKIESPTRRAYHLTALLCGCRPGELARLKWADVLPRERCFVIRGAKADNDIQVPLSPAIVRALKMVRGADDVFVFPGCAQIGHRDPLPARGNQLRHTFRTLAADCAVDEMLAHFLMGHSPEGISQKYIVKMMLASGPALRQAQRKISRRIVTLLAL
jgi:integrase